jgi:hypothetical protein
MAIDQRDVSSTLRFMDDRALQQYAAMYKNDPYIFPLAFQESQNRQRLRMSQQGAQGMQPMPKVNEQALAQMAPQQLPEDQGIATLAAPNMQQMADGGIAGYDDADFVSRSEPVVMMAGGGHIPRYQGNPQDGSLVRGRTSWEDELERLQAPPQESSALGRGIVNAFTYSSDFEALVQSAKAKQARGIPLTAPEARALQSEEAPTATKKESPFEQERARNMARVANEGYTRGDPRALPTMPSGKEQLSSVAAPKVDTERKDTGRRDERKDPSAKTDSVKPSVLDPKAMFDTALEKTSKEVRPEKALLETLVADRKKADEEELKGLQGLNKKFEDAFKSKRERLDTREGEISKMKDQSMGLALLQAGARMMSTRGSVGEAIGAGIDTGTKQYVAGLDKINTAKDKLAEARDRLDELQLNRDEMSAREILKAESKIRQTALSGQETMIKYVMERDNVDRDTAMKVVDNQIKISLEREGNLSRETVARISAAPAFERNALLKLANNKDDKVRTEYGKLQAKVMDTLGKDPNYTMANPMQQQVLQTNALRQALMSNPFLAPYAAGIGFSSAPTGGKVYDLTED